MTKSKQNNKIRYIQHALSVILIALIAYVAWYKYNENLAFEKSKALNEMVLSQASSSQDNASSSPVSSIIADPLNPSTPQILFEYQKLHELNSDMVGFISIEDTTLSLPVVQGNNNSYYLEHDFYKQEDKAGSIFVDCQTNLKDAPVNTLIYGHQMRNKSMFGILQGYKDVDFYKKHKIIQFDSLYQKRSYEVMSVFLTEINTGVEGAFNYYEFKSIETEQQFNSYIENIANLSLIKTDVTATFGDELITLSTCDDFSKNSRLVVVGKKIT